MSRCLAVVCSAIVGLVALGTATTAYAHGDTIRLTVAGITDGHPQFTAVWENDKDPVAERIAGTMSAIAANGTSVGPWRLVPVPRHPGSLTTNEALPPGRWNITVATAFPSMGRGDGTADVPVIDPLPSTTPPEPAAGTPGAVIDPVPAGPTATADSTAPAAVPANAPTARPKEHTSPWRRARATAAVTAVSIAAIAVAVMLLRRSLGS